MKVEIFLNIDESDNSAVSRKHFIYVSLSNVLPDKVASSVLVLDFILTFNVMVLTLYKRNVYIKL
jgi:hypothetical protein